MTFDESSCPLKGHLGMMFYKQQACRCGTLRQFMCLGPIRSNFERLFCGVDVSVSVEAETSFEQMAAMIRTDKSA